MCVKYQVGDEVVYNYQYYNPYQEIEYTYDGCGIVADVLQSPLTGKWKYRIVDTLSDCSDMDSGKWIDEEQITSVIPLNI